MKTIRVEGIIQAISPIHHGGDEKTGSETMLRRMKYYVGDKIIEIPYISGNAIRGYLRRLVMQDFLERLSYKVRNLKLYHALFSGGVLETVDTGAGVIDLELLRAIRKYLVPISVFGFAYRNQIVEGKLIVGHALPICRELNEYLPHKSDKSFYEFLDWEFATRKEEIKADKKSDEPKVQMLYRYEVFIPGTRFYHHFVLLDMNNVEESFFTHMLKLWSERSFIAGRSSAGCGEIILHYDTSELNGPETYIDFINRNRDEIIGILEGLEG